MKPNDSTVLELIRAAKQRYGRQADLTEIERWTMPNGFPMGDLCEEHLEDVAYALCTTGDLILRGWRPPGSVQLDAIDSGDHRFPTERDNESEEENQNGATEAAPL